jgi:hypothetical protein
MKEKTTILSSAAVHLQRGATASATGGWKRKSPGETGIKGSVGAWEMSGKRERKRGREREKKNTKQNANGIVAVNWSCFKGEEKGEKAS